MIGERGKLKMSTSSRYKAFSTAIGSTISFSLNAIIYALIVIFISPVCKAIGASLTQFQIVLTMCGLGMIISNLFLGEMFKKYNPKILCIIGAFGASAIYCTIAFSKSIYLMWIGGLIFGTLYGACGQTLLNVMVSGWFNQGAGTVLGISTMISNLFTVFANPIAARLIVQYGYQKIAIYLATVIPAIVILTSLFLIYQLPSKYGESPINFGKTKKKSQEKIKELSLSLPVMAKSKVFVAVFIGLTLATVATTMYFNNSMTIFQEKGLSYLEAANFVSIVAIASMISVTLVGWLSDHIGVHITLAIYCSLVALDMFLYPLLSGTVGCFIFAVLISANQCCYMYGPLTLPKIFGPETSAPLLGWVGVAIGIGAMIGGPLASYLDKLNGNFNLAFLIGGLCFVLLLIITLFITSTKTLSDVRKLAKSK
jgi:MFS family permease